MLKMGGSEIFRQLAGKSVRADKVEYVYQWVDPNKEVFQSTGEFLTATSKEDFDKKYALEKEY